MKLPKQPLKEFTNKSLEKSNYNKSFQNYGRKFAQIDHQFNWRMNFLKIPRGIAKGKILRNS